MTFQEAMRRQNEKLQKYLQSGGACIPSSGNELTSGTNTVACDPRSDNHPSEPQDVWEDVARAMLSIAEV